MFLFFFILYTHRKQQAVTAAAAAAETEQIEQATEQTRRRMFATCQARPRPSETQSRAPGAARYASRLVQRFVDTTGSPQASLSHR